jgi:anti-sigma factor RsiW
MRLLLHHTTEEALVALLDGELPLPERVSVERHLAACTRCSDLLARQEQAQRALGAELAADRQAVEQSLHWRLRPAAKAAGASVLAGSVGALVLAGMLLRRHQRRGSGLRALAAG